MDDNEKKAKAKEDVLAKDKKEQTPEQANREIPTIMPTMIDESDQIKKVRDLSAIIPHSNEKTALGKDEIELISKDNELKSDGATIIANIDENDEITIRANFAYPEQIDIEARKEEKSRLQNRKKKKKKRNLQKVLKNFKTIWQ